jgi:threonine aldolase
MKTFASDNYSGVHPEILQALSAVNKEHAAAYGADEITRNTIKKIETYFGKDIDVYFVYNGTGANVVSLSAITQSYQAIICSDVAHIQVDESTAPEKFTGCRLLPVPSVNGKIRPDDIQRRIQRVGDQHHPQARAISVSQPTEYGTVYTVEEIRAISEVAKKNNLLLHMDGSRISNAAVSLGKPFREFTCDAGVDVLSFGGTKNGMMFGEAVLFFNKAVSQQVKFIRKQSMQLHSKMRFISAQFEALLTNELWKKNALHSNAMARLLETELKKFASIKITRPVEANGVFVIIPPAIISGLQKESFFYIWNEAISEARLMCSFDTTEEDVYGFIKKLRELLT